MNDDDAPVTQPDPQSAPTPVHDPQPAHESQPEFVTVQTTVEDEVQAERLASTILEADLGACVQVSAIRSFYRWRGEVHDDAEQLLTVKTTAAAVPGIKALVEREHPYEEPELIIQAIFDGASGYLDWVRENTSG